MSNVAIFNFESKAIRSVVIDGEPWFVGKDVAESLGYSDTVNALKQHAKGVVKHHPLQTAGGMQEARILSEPDVLRLIVGSKLPSAQVFEAWVFEEVLPSIRKTGKYAVTLSPMEMVIQSAQAIMRIEAAQAEQDAKLAAMGARLDGLNGDTGYRTVTAFLRNEGIKKSLKDANVFGRNCKKLCDEVGIKIGDVPDERFGSVHSYPVEVLREVLNDTK